MSLSGDHDRDMTATTFLHDDAIEAIIRGDEVHSAHRSLANFAERVRALGDGPVPAPSAELSALLGGRAGAGLATLAAVGPEPGGRHGRRTGRNRLRLGPLGKVALGSTLTFAAATAAGAAGILPAAANNAVRGAIEVVSPVEFGSSGHQQDGTNFGGRVSSDATGESDGENGVDGKQISDEAPGSAHRPDGGPADEPPGQSGDTGLTRANQTPAESHAPDEPPADSGDPDGDGQRGVATPTGIDPHGPPVTTPAELRPGDDTAGE